MNEKNETPAGKAIHAFGGVRPLARMLQRNPSSVSRWQKPREQGGTGGAIPTCVQGRLLAIARAEGIELTADDLILSESAA